MKETRLLNIHLVPMEKKKKKKSISFVEPISTQNIYALGSSSSEPLIHSRKKKYLGEREKKKKAHLQM